MRSPKFPVVPAMLFAALIAAAVVDCGGDDTTEGASGSAGKGGSGGGSAGSSAAGSSTAGSATAGSSAGNGGASGGNGGNGGTGGTAGGSAGMAGKAGAGGAATDSGSDAKETGSAEAGDACNVHNVIHTAPTVPSDIALPVTGATLIGGYAASGVQIYTCTGSTADAGVDGGDGGLIGTWKNTATATLSGDNCSTAAQHTFAPGPTWTATDGSVVSAVKGPTAAAPDAGAPAIAWVQLQANPNTGGEGVFANVTWVLRINTAGGVGPSGACDPALVGADGGTLRVPYTADYFFYSGGTSSEAGSDASDDGSADSGG